MIIRYYVKLELNGGFNTDFFTESSEDDSDVRMKEVLKTRVKSIYGVNAINSIVKAAYFIGLTDDPFNYTNIPMD